ncbi:terminase large subunit domain-containing protein [Roseateles chitinivorans]|uniref:phage terminase large subunit family protein n=1 Tax=Roseateles chitinivorans TaxID=2917965 RepID=UPI003D66E966
MDAANSGCDLFDIDELRLVYTREEFENLLMCGFIDDTYSVFPLSELQRCMVDSWEAWDAVKPFSLRPFGRRSVWVGYDPSHTGDTAGCIMVAPSATPSGKFRVLDRHQFNGMDFEAQADFIRKVDERFPP